MLPLERLLNEEEESVLDNAEEEEPRSPITELVLAVGLFVLLMGVGISCKPQLMRKVVRSPKALKAAIIGVTCQFVIMPVAAYLLTLIFQVKGYQALGYILAGSMPGGSSSNVFCMWSQGVLELSVFMTIASTTIAFGMTPLWLYIFSEAVEDIDAEALPFTDIAMTFGFLVIPLSLGFALNFVPCKEKINFYVEKGLSVVAVILFIASVAVVILENPSALKEYGTWQIYLSGFLFFPIATGSAYLLTTILKFRPSVRRTIVMEVGFQNLVLGLAIGEKSVNNLKQAHQALPFPVSYAVAMYLWGTLLVPAFRYQKRYNDENGIEDLDPDFLLQDYGEQGKETATPDEEGKSGSQDGGVEETPGNVENTA